MGKLLDRVAIAERILKENIVPALKAFRLPAPSLAIALTISLAALLGACSKPADKTEDIRPVRTILLYANSGDVSAE